jgi:hypothetical protein
MKEYIKTHFNKLEGILFGFEYYLLQSPLE